MKLKLKKNNVELLIFIKFYFKKICSKNPRNFQFEYSFMVSGTPMNILF